MWFRSYLNGLVVFPTFFNLGLNFAIRSSWSEPQCRERSLAKIACSSSLDPHFIKNDYVTAEIIYITVHSHHEVLTWSWATLCCRDIWAPPRKRGNHYCNTAVSFGSATRRENIVCLLLQLLHQPGENKRVCSSFSSWLLEPSSSLLTHSLPALGSANSADSVNSRQLA